MYFYPYIKSLVIGNYKIKRWKQQVVHAYSHNIQVSIIVISKDNLGYSQSQFSLLDFI